MDVKIFKIIAGTSKFHVPEGWHEAISIP